MKWTLLLTLSTLVVAGAGDGAKDDAKKLQGTWTIVYIENQGKKEEGPKDSTVVFSGNQVTFAIGSDKDTAEFKMDASKKPGWFDITSGDYKSVGIFKMEGDMLYACLNQSGKERPTEFKTEKGTANERLFVLKRGKK